MSTVESVFATLATSASTCLSPREQPTISPNVDVSRYFWYHHTEADTPDKIDPADIARCVALFAVMANTIANMEGIVPRPQPTGP